MGFEAGDESLAAFVTVPRGVRGSERRALGLFFHRHGFSAFELRGTGTSRERQGALRLEVEPSRSVSVGMGTLKRNPALATAKATLHGLRQAAALGRTVGAVCLPRRSRAQRPSPLMVRGRLHELRRRARPRLPSGKLPA